LLQKKLGFIPKIGIEEGIKMAIKDFDNLYWNKSAILIKNWLFGLKTPK
jgi:hypothetical protein